MNFYCRGNVNRNSFDKRFLMQEKSFFLRYLFGQEVEWRIGNRQTFSLFLNLYSIMHEIKFFIVTIERVERASFNPIYEFDNFFVTFLKIQKSLILWEIEGEQNAIQFMQQMHIFLSILYSKWCIKKRFSNFHNNHYKSLQKKVV